MAYAPVHEENFHGNMPYPHPVEQSRYVYDGQEHIVSSTNQSQHPSTHEPKGQYANVDFHEVTPYWSDPARFPTAPSHQRGWSESTVATEAIREKSLLTSSGSAPSSIRTKASGSLLKSHGSWTLETVTIIIAFGAVGSILGVLARFNGQALPEWPYYITLNALIALLATVVTATMSISLQNGLSQLKWIRFKESKAPLTDMEIFDEASRGTWGAIKLLATARGGFLGSFGAIVAIFALALGPFAQQVVTYETRATESLEGASVNKALNYTGALPGKTSSTGFVPLLPLKSAVYNGLFAENGRPGASLAFECQSGNCTWDPYETLGACHECVDLTSFIQQYCDPNQGEEDSTGCGWQVPQGAKLSNSLEVFSLTSQIPSAQGNMPHSTVMRLIFMGTEAHDGLAGETKPWARQCSLSACLQTLSTTVSNGILAENTVSQKIDNAVLDISNLDDGNDHNVYVDGSNSTRYLVGIEAMLGMRAWFSTVFANGSAIRNPADFNRTVSAQDSVVVNLTVGISSGVTFFDSDIVTAFYWNYYEYPGGLDLLMSDMATSMTVAFRSFTGAAPVPGRALSTQSYVHVRWGFAVLPILVVVGAAIFLLLAVYRTKRSHTKAWKSSALAMLFHGLDGDIRAQFERGGSLRDKKLQARGLKVQLDQSDDNGSLLRA